MRVGVCRSARRLLTTADGGDSNRTRTDQSQRKRPQLANTLGLENSVCHYPPGTSDWIQFEERMLRRTTENWRGRLLVSRAVVANPIGPVPT